MKLIFHPAARAEVEETVSFYEDRAVGLGEEFLNEVLDAADRITEYPEVGFSVTVRLRRYVLKRFPYSLLYHLREDIVEIAAVMHHRRKPGYWEDRI